MATLRYELLLEWRRAALPALAVGLLVTPLIGGLIARPDFRGYRAALAAGTLAVEVARAEISAALVPVIWLGGALIATLMLPLVAAEVVPRDRQVGVRELLDSLPMSPATYLAGKLLGLWSGLLLGVALAALLAGLAWRLLIGPFDLGLYLEVWFVGVLGLAWINAGSGMLLAAGQPTLRRGLLVGAAYVLLCLAGLASAFLIPADWWRWLNPARPALLLYYLLGFPGAVEGYDAWTRSGLAVLQDVAGRGDVFRSLAAGLAQLVLIGVLTARRLGGNNPTPQPPSPVGKGESDAPPRVGEGLGEGSS